MVTRTDLVVAAAAAAWAAVFLAGEGALVAFAPLFGLATLPYRRRPVVAALAVAAVVLAAILAGMSEENPASLAAGLTTTFALGRYATGARAYGPVPLLAAALTAVDGLTVADAVFVMFILTATWTCGRLVHRRSDRAERAAATAAELAARDPAALAAAVVAEERARLAGDALAVIRAAVDAMHRHAIAAERELDPGALRAIQDGGREAVAELRRLLGLLRAQDDRPAEPELRRRPRVPLLVAGALMALVLVDVAAWNAGAQPGAILLTLAFAGSHRCWRSRSTLHWPTASRPRWRAGCSPGRPPPTAGRGPCSPWRSSPSSPSSSPTASRRATKASCSVPSR